jgi:hypothetical protein
MVIVRKPEVKEPRTVRGFSKSENFLTISTLTALTGLTGVSQVPGEYTVVPFLLFNIGI